MTKGQQIKTNIYKQALEVIQSSRYVLIVTHINPDADTISCGLALGNFMEENKLKHKVFSYTKNIPNNLNYLNRFEKITSKIPDFYDLIIYVDCADEKRGLIENQNNVKTINIDHHTSNNNFADVNIVDYAKASTAEVLYDFFKNNELDISSNVATCLYTGMYSDSLGFSTPRVNDETLKIAHHLSMCGANPFFIADQLIRRESLAKFRLLPIVLNSLELYLEGKVGIIYVLPEWLNQTGAKLFDIENGADMVLSIAVVDIAILLCVTSDKTIVSMRSKNNVDVLKIALQLNGGGHKMAAGCRINTTNIQEVREQILNLIKKEI